VFITFQRLREEKFRAQAALQSERERLNKKTRSLEAEIGRMAGESDLLRASVILTCIHAYMHTCIHAYMPVMPAVHPYAVWLRLLILNDFS